MLYLRSQPWVQKAMILLFTAVTPSFAATESYTIKGDDGALFRLQLDKNNDIAELHALHSNETLPPSVKLLIKRSKEADLELNLLAKGPPGQPQPVYSGRLRGWSGSYANLVFEVRWSGKNGNAERKASSEKK